MRTLAICLCLMSVTAAADEPAPSPRFVKAWGQEGTADGEFEFPIGIAIHEQTIFVTDHYNNRVQTFDFDGRHLASLEVLPNSGGITVDPQDHIGVASINGRIQQSDTNGKPLGGLQSSQGSEPGKFLAPHSLAFNSRGEFFVVDSFNHRIQKFAMC